MAEDISSVLEGAMLQCRKPLRGVFALPFVCLRHISAQRSGVGSSRAACAPRAIEIALKFEENE